MDPLSIGGEDRDELWMEEALRAAQRALEMGEVPVGAVVVFEGRIVGRGHNRNDRPRAPRLSLRPAQCVALRLRRDLTCDTLSAAADLKEGRTIIMVPHTCLRKALEQALLCGRRQPRKVPVRMLIVTHVDTPSAN